MKQERVEFRTSNRELIQFEMAATYLGMTLSGFLRMAALERAAEIVKENNTLVLSDKDRDLFLAALETPPKPNKNLKKALSEYKKKSI